MDALMKPVAAARLLSEGAPESDIDKMLHDYVKPAFLKMSSENQKKAIDMINQMAQEG